MTDTFDTVEAEMIAHLQRRGYIVRHESEARAPLSWHRTEPIPQGVNFEAEAVEKLAGQIAKEHIHFTERRLASGQAVRSAYLRVLA